MWKYNKKSLDNLFIFIALMFRITSTVASSAVDLENSGVDLREIDETQEDNDETQEDEEKKGEVEKERLMDGKSKRFESS